jgi:hypothetical protein
MPFTHDVFLYLQETYTKPSQSLFEKKGRGIYRRFFYEVPVRGEGSVNYIIPDCDTLDGSSNLHQFRDIGVAGQLLVRTRSCHHCECCWVGRWSECVYRDIVGKEETVTLKPVGNPAVPVTRSVLLNRGLELSAQLEVGDFCVIELDDQNEGWMICETVEKMTTLTGNRTSSIGTSSFDFRSGDKVVQVRKLEPIQPGSRLFVKTEKKFPVFAEDMRVTKIGLRELTSTRAGTSRSSALANPHAQPAAARWELSVEDKDNILLSLSRD